MNYLERTSETLRTGADRSGSPLFRTMYTWLAHVVDSSTDQDEAAKAIANGLPRKKRGEAMVTETARNIAKQIKSGQPMVCL